MLIEKITEKVRELVNFNTNGIRLMFQDEDRFGRISKPKRFWCKKGIRPSVLCQIVREYTYAYAAV